ncbi:TolC family protein [Pseudooceanicola aestuarii]|uniref:TolC family protein n=1 Tax=Pseudooceanicola aestuarii TaxID=2697319 RepID=UPI0013CFE354|nr:TolC family protein [Pseudooceanicola aestuarii]
MFCDLRIVLRAPLFTLVCLTSALSLLPQGGQGQSLGRAVLLGASRDPEVAALRQDVARETSNIEIEKDARRPQFSLSGDVDEDEGYDLGIAVTVSQLLFDWGLSQSQIDAATANRVKVVANLKAAVEDLTLEIAELYFDLDTISRKMRRTVDYVAFARRIAKYSADRVVAGVAGNAETSRARLEIARAEQLMFQLESDRQNALAELEYRLGPTSGAKPAPPRLSFIDAFASSRNVIEAVMNAPEYIAARADVSIAEAGVRAAKASRKPTLKLQAQGRQDLTGGRGRSGSVGLTAGVDLTSSGFRGRAVIAAEQSLRAAVQRLTGVERDLQNEARFYRQNLRALTVSAQSLAGQVGDAQKVLDDYEQQFVVGQRELVDLLLTARDLYDAEIEEIDTRHELLRTEYEAAHSVGMLGTMLLGTQGN